MILVGPELSAAGISFVDVEASWSRGVLRVDRFVGHTLVDLARFIAWADRRGVTFTEATSIDGQSLNVDAGRTLAGIGRAA